jgi:hypothetical protein
MSEKKAKQAGTDKPTAVYFKSLTIRDVKCFRGEHTIDLSDGKGRPAQWTVILGNNNTGKTTILKCLAQLEPIWDNSEFYTFLPNIFSGNVIFAKILYSLENLKKGIALSDYQSYEWSWGNVKPATLAHYDPSQIYDFGCAFQMTAYGASRKMSENGLKSQQIQSASLLQNADLFNAESWMVQLHFAQLEGHGNAKLIFEKASQILTGGLLPDVTALKVTSEQEGQSFSHFLQFQTDFGWIRLRDLGYGYQTMLVWVLDLVRRMFERYPDSPNPIREPAIVLVDEIDLHLHPEWQRKIIAHLTQYFPNTQFIVTAHSPLVVQSAEKINLVLLEKDGDHVNIRQPKIPSYQGWSLEEILTELMGLGERTHSEKYLELMRQFEEALDNDNYENAQAAYDELDKILHPTSHQRKLLRLQMSSLMPA